MIDTLDSEEVTAPILRFSELLFTEDCSNYDLSDDELKNAIDQLNAAMRK